jgi:hypothetical protein
LDVLEKEGQVERDKYRPNKKKYKEGISLRKGKKEIERKEVRKKQESESKEAENEGGRELEQDNENRRKEERTRGIEKKRAANREMGSYSLEG